MKAAAKLLVTLGATITAHAAPAQQIGGESLRTRSMVAAEEEASQDWQAEADAIVKAAWPAEGPGLSVLVTRNGKTLYSHTRGLSDIEGGKPVTLDTVFRIGSMTKQFTAALVLTLAEEGKLSLDDPLAKFVRGYPAPGGRATVRQLLNHTSGIQSYNEIPGWFAEPNTRRAFTTAELIAVFRDLPARFEPGTDWAYNNSGYVLLAAIIEAVTKQSWHLALRERITAPLGLASIRHDWEEDGISERVAQFPIPPVRMVSLRRRGFIQAFSARRAPLWVRFAISLAGRRLCTMGRS